VVDRPVPADELEGEAGEKRGESETAIEGHREILLLEFEPQRELEAARCERLGVASEVRVEAGRDALPRALHANTQVRHGHFARVSARLVPAPLSQKVVRFASEITKLHARMHPALARALAHRRKALNANAKLLASLGYRSVLRRGFVLVMGPDEKPLRSARDATAERAVALEFHDGRAAARIEGGEAKSDARPARKPRKAKAESGQGSLF